MNRIAWLSVLGAAMVCAGCEEKSNTPPKVPTGSGGAPSGLAEKAAGAIEGAKERAEEAFTKLRNDAVAALEPRMAEARTQVSKLKEKVAGLPAAVKPTVESGMKEVEKQLGAAEEQFDKLKAAGAEAWESISRDLGVTIDRLTASIKDLSGKMPG